MIVEFLVLGSGAYWLTHSLNQKKKQPLDNKLQCFPKKKKSNRFLTQSKRLVEDIVSAVSGKAQQEQQRLLKPEAVHEMQNMERATQRHNRIALAAIGIALLGTVYPALNIVAGGLSAYIMYPLFKLGWEGLKKKKITTFVADSIFVLGLLAFGYVLIAAFIALISSYSMRLMMRVESRSRAQLVNIFDGQQQTVWIETNGVEMEIPFDQVKAGDVAVVHAGEVIPVDGYIKTGIATIDQHILTGEAQPVEKHQGDKVFASTLVIAGRISVLVETAAQDSVAAQIGNILNETRHYTDGRTSRGQEIANNFVVPSLLLSAVTLPLLGPSSALAVLYVPIGTDMRATGPLTVLNFLQILSRQGILIKDGRVLEYLQQVNTVVFDKTGTLTEEQPTVNTLYAFNSFDEAQLLWYAAAAEYRQPHPIAKAILAKAEQQQLELPQPDDADYEMGYGIKVKIGLQHIRVGSHRFLTHEAIALPDEVEAIRQRAEEYGFSLIYVAVDQVFAGVLELEPTIRAETAAVIRALHAQGKELFIISGDHEQPTRHLAEKLGIDRYFAETLPEHKADLVQKLRDEGKFICFVGDGINDAIALKTAQISVSLRGASTAATDTAQIVLMDGHLGHLPEIFKIADEFENTMQANFLSATVPGILALGGVFFLGTGVVTSMFFRYIALFSGLGNSMWPLIKYQEIETQEKSLPIKDSKDSLENNLQT